MNNFSEILGRLKFELRVSKDGEVARALGISPSAFSERKKNNSFPEKDLLALVARKPELRVDVDYVLMGVSAKRLNPLNEYFVEEWSQLLAHAQKTWSRDWVVRLEEYVYKLSNTGQLDKTPRSMGGVKAKNKVKIKGENNKVNF